jgi:hypothetical protein
VLTVSFLLSRAQSFPSMAFSVFLVLKKPLESLSFIRGLKMDKGRLRHRPDEAIQSPAAQFSTRAERSDSRATRLDSARGCTHLHGSLGVGGRSIRSRSSITPLRSTVTATASSTMGMSRRSPNARALRLSGSFTCTRIRFRRQDLCLPLSLSLSLSLHHSLARTGSVCPSRSRSLCTTLSHAPAACAPLALALSAPLSRTHRQRVPVRQRRARGLGAKLA